MPQSKARGQILLNDILFQKIIFNKTKLRYCEQRIVNYRCCFIILKNICEKIFRIQYLHKS